MRRFRKEFGLKKARILRERLIPVSQGVKIGINRQPLLFVIFRPFFSKNSIFNSKKKSYDFNIIDIMAKKVPGTKR